MRLWLLGEVKGVETGLKDLIRVMVERADKEKAFLMPGYTHLQVWLTLEANPIFLIYMTCVSAWTADSMVTSTSLTCILIPRRLATPPTTDSPHFCSAPRLRSSRWEPLRGRPRVPRKGARVLIRRREQLVWCWRSRLHR